MNSAGRCNFLLFPFGNSVGRSFPLRPAILPSPYSNRILDSFVKNAVRDGFITFKTRLPILEKNSGFLSRTPPPPEFMQSNPLERIRLLLEDAKSESATKDDSLLFHVLFHLHINKTYFLSMLSTNACLLPISICISVTHFPTLLCVQKAEN